MFTHRPSLAQVCLVQEWVGWRTIWVLFVTAVVVGFHPSAAHAQQNLFNVPIPETAKPNDIFFQQQINISTQVRLGTAYTTIDYGLTRDLEIGLNVFNVQLYPGGNTPQLGEADQAGLLINGQKTFEIFDHFKTGLGTQVGLSSTGPTNSTDLLQFSWLTGMWEPIDGEYGRYVIGCYFGNHNYLGNGNRVGYLIGAEIPIIRERLSFVGDYISGTNNSSVAVVGLVANVWRDWQFSLGVQLPSPHSPNSYGLVFELTRIPGLDARPFFGSPRARSANGTEPEGF